MSTPKTLLELAGAPLDPATVESAAIVMIDMQNEYLDGPIALPGAETAVGHAAKLLDAAREAGAPILHIAHKGRPGSLFDREAPRGAFIDAVTPKQGEGVIEKGLPNAFADTDLDAALREVGRTQLILAGFMTHMCVSSTARAALDLGYRVTVEAEACATRPLPDGTGGTIDADDLHRAALIALSDRFAVIARGRY